MAVTQIKISDLPVATSLDGNEVIEVVQGGTSVRVEVSKLASTIADSKGAYQIAVDNGFVGTEEQWLLSLVGPQGIAGLDGVNGTNGLDGKSAYQLAVNNGFQGSLTQWLTSLIGPKGADGLSGRDGVNGTNGADGNDGLNGKSAYQTAVDNGFVGTESQWLLSLVGTNGVNGVDGQNGVDGVDGSAGKSAYEIAIASGFVGTEAQWLSSLVGINGVDGESAYQLAVVDGFVGTETQWLASLVGPQGPAGISGDQGIQGPIGPQGAPGDTGSQGPAGNDGTNGQNGESAYQLAVDQGFVGTIDQWLASLVGPQGVQGIQGLKGDTGADGIQGPTGQKGDTGAQGIPGIVPALTVLTSEALSAGDFVNVYNNGGTLNVRRANAALGQRAHGFILTSVLSGANASVYTIGVNTAVTGQTIGDVFLQTSPGQAGSAVPTDSGQIVQNLGTALSATSINFESKLVITLA